MSQGVLLYLKQCRGSGIAFSLVSSIFESFAKKFTIFQLDLADLNNFKRAPVYDLNLKGKSANKTQLYNKYNATQIQQDPVGHYQLGQKNTVYLEMIYLGVQCMYFRAKPLQNQCILGLVHYTK